MFTTGFILLINRKILKKLVANYSSSFWRCTCTTIWARLCQRL